MANDGLFKPKTAEGAIKPKAQWTPDERRVVLQDQCLKSIIVSCLPDDIMESVISCETTKDTWTDLVHSFEGPSDNKETRIMDLKLEYQTFKAKPSKSLSQTYTRYKSLLNELAIDGVNLSKHEINVGFVNSLREKWLTFYQEQRSANHTQTLDLADIYGRFVYEDNLIQIRNCNDENEEEVSDDEEVTRVKALMALADDELTVGKNHARNSEWIDITTRKVERLNPDSKLPNFNTGRILVPESQPVNESLKPKETTTNPESSKDSEAESLTPLPPLKILHGASPSLEVESLTFQPHSPKERPGLGIMKYTKPKTQDSLNKSVSGTVTVSDTEPTTPLVPIKVKNTEQKSKINELTKLVQMLIDEKAQPYQYASPSKEILNAKSKPFPSCPHCGFNDHRPDDYRNYPEGGVLAESSQSSESSIGVKCNTCGITIHSTTDHNEFDHFKREIYQGAHLIPAQWMLKEYDWCQKLSAQICRATSLISVNHEKYTLVIVDEYSRYTWVYFLRKKSQAAEMIMTFIEMVENQNDVKVKQIITNNGTEFKNYELESFCDKKGISHNFSSPYTPEQNRVAKRKNRTLIKAARTMLNGSVLLKNFWTKAIRIACYTQNRLIIVKRHDETPYEIFRERIPDISYFYVFRCPVFIHNHKDHLGKFDAKANDGYFLGYSFNSKAFRVFNIRRQQIKETYHVTFDKSIDAIRWSKDQHIELVNIIGDPGKGMLTRSMATKLTAASASECLFADFLSEIEPQKVSEALKHPGWVDAMQ
ncbi:retrovirus-related pol polyprotein from transposon TNT 1-94 [Tanacetum coccineum]